MDERDALPRQFAKLADGCQRENVLNAAGILIINALRQSHRSVADAEREMADLFERMGAVMRERHYDENGERRVHNIVVPHPRELFPAAWG